jgi:hypothetical protein
MTMGALKAAAGLLFYASFAQAQDQDRPLPDQAKFLQEFRKTLHTPDKLLSQYTYTEKETESKYDSKGKVTSSETNTYQVLHGAEEWQTYRRHISKNGKLLPPEELEKQDRKEKERVQKETRKRAGWSESKRQQEKAKAEKEERESADDIFGTFDFQFVRRETIDGVSTILVNFTPKKNYKPKTGDARELQHVAGRVWISEEDHQLAKLEAEVIDSIKIGAGLLAKVQKGSTLKFELRKINNEIWLPVRGEIMLNARVLLLKGWNVGLVLEFSDHKKFNVDTILEFKETP